MTRARARLAIAALGAAAALACVTPASQQLQHDLDGMQQQLWKVQKENVALNDQVAALRSEAVRPAAEASSEMSAADLKLRLEALDRDLTVLRSRADDTDQRFESLARDLRLIRQTVEGMTRTPPSTSTGPAPDPSMVAVPAAGASAEARPAGPATSLAVEETYRQASADWSRGDSDAALRGMQEVLRAAPKGDLADDAQYLIGEIQYGQERYPEAVSAFDALLQNFPGSDKAAAAYYKKGLAFLALNRTADAVIQFQHVVSRFPKSDEARLARERLRALGLKDR